MTDPLLPDGTFGAILPDGTYNAFVLDCVESSTTSDNEAAGPASLTDRPSSTLTLAIVTGEHKGETLDVVAVGLDGGFAELVGVPATLVVHEGTPSVTVEAD